MASKGRHVVPHRDDGWAVKKPGSDRVSTVARKQADAEKMAKRQVAGEDRGEVRIHGRDSKIRDSDTVKSGRDPNPPKDNRH